ncbi:hypothetical protein OSCT_1815 [Oscillochloris trichoides DG-6]|uniref:Baseplate protein J-like domain-containing protein n=1 Tax=Oscillochloris trichoides DG-6 TaxID=765420 RepID=E1IER4_9CHLR|nr:hypothetical protein [Oscillochloris trichoides]EFO80356.1 hypothetical protein OSCT_1815 [Oscillochloris trichoides DG-6]
MVADETALILALPNDTADTLQRKIGQSGARRVQLLVPEGVPGLQLPDQLERLHTLIQRAGVELVLITSDQQTLQAARFARIETLEVDDARVVAPTPGPARAVPPASPAPPARPSTPDLSASDAAFLDALDDLDALPPSSRTGLSPADEDLFAALEDLSPPARGRATSDDDDFADALDSIDMDEADLRSAAPRGPVAPPPPKRIRPEDIELSASEKARANQTGRRTPPPPPPRPSRPEPKPAPRQRPNYDEEAVLLPPRRQNLLIPILIALILLIAFGLSAFFFLGKSVTVQVAPPIRSDQIEPITAMMMPLAAPGMGGGTAVEVQTISSDVAVSVAGQVTESVMAASGSAQGTITIYNSSPQTISLPAGSEFIAVKPDGQEVPFINNVDVTIPPSVTVDQGAQIITTRGTATIDLIARSAGSASNVEPNSLRRIVLPGGQTFNINSGALIVQHGPLTGGSEAPVWIVKEQDVQAVLGQALAQLEVAAQQQLQGLALAGGMELEPTTISPRRVDLEQLQGFTYTPSPGIGETVDPQNPTFTVIVQARYSALVSAPGVQIENQLSSALTEMLRQSGALKPGDCKAAAITNWTWDGERLTVDGQITPNTQDPACGPGLSSAVLDQVRAAIRGKSRADAEAALIQMQQQGLIGTYVLPNVAELPGWDFQLRIESR